MITLKTNPGDRLLELGCGSNPNPSCQVHVDVRQCFDAAGNPTTDFSCDFNQPLPIKDADFDGILSQYCLEHLSWRNVKGFLRECYRILKPGGKVVFVTPNTEAQINWIRDHGEGWDGKDSFESFSCVLFGDLDYPENSHKCWLSPAIATGLFQEAEFSNILVRPYGARGTDMCLEATKLTEVTLANVIEWNSAGQTVEKPAQRYTREEMFDRHYFGGGGKVGGYAREGYWDYPVHHVTAKHVMDRKPESVLEIGAGRGYIVKRLQDAGIKAAGLEISKHCYLTRACDNIYLFDLCKSAGDLWPFASHVMSAADPSMNFIHPFDLCFSIAVFEHIPEANLAGIFSEMKRVSKRGLHGIDFGEKDDGFDKTHCFPAGTLVTMADGCKRPIEQVRTGDYVLGIESNRNISAMVRHAYRHTNNGLLQLTLSNGGNLTATIEHPVMTRRGWVEMQDLKIGDQLYAIDATANHVCSKELSHEELSGTVRDSRRFVGMVASVCGQQVASQAWSVGTIGMDGSGKTDAARNFRQVSAKENPRSDSDKEMGVDSSSGSTHGIEANHRRGIQRPIEGVDIDTSGSRLHCGNHRWRGIGLSVEGEESGFAAFDVETWDAWQTAARAESRWQGMACEWCHGMQHGPQDDGVHSGAMRWNNVCSKAESKTEWLQSTILRVEYPWFPGVTDIASNHPIHDYQESCGRHGYPLLDAQIFQTEERSAYERGIRTVCRMAEVMSIERVAGMGNEVFNLETETENYVADGYLVHNCTLKPLSWWRNIFDAHGLQSHEIVDKEDLERGDIPYEILKGDGKVKLNIGSFTTQFHYGWTNLDIVDLSQFSQAYHYNFKQVDVRNGLPYQTGTVDLVFICHVLEHFTYQEGLSFLRECRRVIKPDGFMRLIVPDAELLCGSLWNAFDRNEGLIRDPDALKEFDEINDAAAAYPTAAGKLWSLLFAGHQAAYDWETMQWSLNEAGFIPKRQSFRQSDSKQMLKETIDMIPCLSLFCDATPRTA